VTFRESDGTVLGPAQWTLARHRRDAQEPSVCPGCGLVLPAYKGPTHAYVGASPACWRLYGQVVTLSWGKRDGLPLDRLVVNTYGAQHPGERQVRSVQSVALHLMGLCLALERGEEPRIMPTRDRKLSRRTLDLHWLEPPRPNGTLTLRGPLGARGPDEHAASVEAWASDVWAAWEAHHGTVREWLDVASRGSP
jgi:Family of unknown function (DUF5946)